MVNSGSYGLIIAEYLCLAGRITKHAFDESATYQKVHGGLISFYLLAKGHIEPGAITDLLTTHYDVRRLVVPEEFVDREVLDLLPADAAIPRLAFPLRMEEGKLLVAMVEPTSGQAIREMESTTGCSILAGVAEYGEIINAYRIYYGISEDDYRSLRNMDFEEKHEIGVLLDELLLDVDWADESGPAGMDLTGDTDGVVRTVDRIMNAAVAGKVDAVHVEPGDKGFRVRFRKDGRLTTYTNLPLITGKPVITRLKILGSLDITERRLPQSGKCKIKYDFGEAEFYVFTLPTASGESLVLENARRMERVPGLEELGFSPAEFDRLTDALDRRSGLIIVSGPGGSGRSTTAYSMIKRLVSGELKIITVEDSAKYDLPGTLRVNVNSRLSMDYARALMAVRRHDPDVVLVGDIRDGATAELAVDMALSGRLVILRMNAGSAFEAVSGLTEIGLDRVRLVSALICVVSQRLVRLLCPKCKKVQLSNEETLAAAGLVDRMIAASETYGHSGCKSCRMTGYDGRTAVYEAMEMIPGIRKEFLEGTPPHRLTALAAAKGMHTLRQNALDLYRRGDTSLDEVLRCTDPPEFVGKRIISAQLQTHFVGLDKSEFFIQ